MLYAGSGGVKERVMRRTGMTSAVFPLPMT